MVLAYHLFKFVFILFYCYYFFKKYIKIEFYLFLKEEIMSQTQNELDPGLLSETELKEIIEKVNEICYIIKMFNL